MTPGIAGVEEEAEFADAGNLEGCSATRCSWGIRQTRCRPARSPVNIIWKSQRNSFAMLLQAKPANRSAAVYIVKALKIPPVVVVKNKAPALAAARSCRWSLPP